jgi:phosphoribosylformylglycinamidine cyclo-ligase
MAQKPVTYAAAGVDINRQDDALARIKPLVKATRTPGVRSDIGLFGGLFSAAFTEGRPILVASMDGVGTKMNVARQAGIWDTVGADLVNHCVNDILVQGARPLFFLDYVAAQRLEPPVVEQIVKGMADACRANGCALLGGEMAEMPGVYAEGEVDVAGTIVGVVDEPDLLPRTAAMAEGDVLVGLPSTGLHTNGYSLARKVCFEVAGLTVADPLPGTGKTVGEALLAVHRSYLAPVLPLVRARRLVAMAHITGGGLTDNLPRVLPGHLDAAIETRSWVVPPLFSFLMEKAAMPIEDARRSFNLGVGMVLVAPRAEVRDVLGQLAAAGEQPWVLGELVAGTGKVVYR